MRQVEARLRTSLASAGVTLDGFFFCPHAADAGCDCRAPALALVRRAAEMLGFAPSETVVIGSTPSYVHMGRILGVPSILVPPGRGSAATSRADGHPDFVVDSLEVAADVIPHIPLSLHRSRVSDAPGASRSAGRGDRMS
jgi:D-glycero-D-manno-heptose 1,7-bisphosphate phosphatase